MSLARQDGSDHTTVLVLFQDAPELPANYYIYDRDSMIILDGIESDVVWIRPYDRPATSKALNSAKNALSEYAQYNKKYAEADIYAPGFLIWRFPSGAELYYENWASEQTYDRFYVYRNEAGNETKFLCNQPPNNVVVNAETGTVELTTGWGDGVIVDPDREPVFIDFKELDRVYYFSGVDENGNTLYQAGNRPQWLMAVSPDGRVTESDLYQRVMPRDQLISWKGGGYSAELIRKNLRPIKNSES